jgi:hypothetical protein
LSFPDGFCRNPYAVSTSPHSQTEFRKDSESRLCGSPMDSRPYRVWHQKGRVLELQATGGVRVSQDIHDIHTTPPPAALRIWNAGESASKTAPPSRLRCRTHPQQYTLQLCCCRRMHSGANNNPAAALSLIMRRPSGAANHIQESASPASRIPSNIALYLRDQVFSRRTDSLC